MARCLKPPASLPYRHRRYHSRPVSGGQPGIHRQLLQVLAKHLHGAYKKPVTVYSRTLFATVEDLRRQINKPVILDAGCGTGVGTQLLATENSHALVIGVDKSSHRLARGGLGANIGLRANCLLLKMDLLDFWRLAVQHGWRLQKHYLLYPNPWPKLKHLLRRWYAHPVFPELLSLGGVLEMRCNWRVYAEEFHAAMEYIAPGACLHDAYAPQTSISLFEQKYAGSGHVIYRCRCVLDTLVSDNQYIGHLQPVLPVNREKRPRPH